MDPLPRNLAEAAHAEGRQDWLTSVLPAVVGQVRERWSLTIGEPFQPGVSALLPMAPAAV